MSKNERGMPYVTADDCCSVCGEHITFDDLEFLQFQPKWGRMDGDRVRWTKGMIVCPHCEVTLWVEA